MTAPTDPALIREAALIAGVCARPVISKVSDLDTGDTRIVPISCGSTREDRCPPCAERARRLRMHQCREGWHLTTEPKRQSTVPEDEDDQGGLSDELRVECGSHPAATCGGRAPSRRAGSVTGSAVASRARRRSPDRAARILHPTTGDFFASSALDPPAPPVK